MRWPWSKKPLAELVWRSQFRSRNPDRCGASLIHFAKSGCGTFEIYDDAKDVLLVSYPRSLRLPAEVFETLNAAKANCNEVNKKSLRHDD